MNYLLPICLLIASLGSGTLDQNATVPGELRSYSTIHSIGVEWDITGDADHDATCRLQYRVKGTEAWKPALPLFRVDFHGWYAETKADRAYNMLAGSILFLEPGTTYEVRLELSDPDGGAESRVLTIATRPVPRLPTGGKTWHVIAGSGGGPWYFIRNQVLSHGYVFKFRVQDRFLLAHNTLVSWRPADPRMHHVLTSVSRNNLFISAGGNAPVWVASRTADPRYTLPDSYTPNWMTDVDYDGFDWGDSPAAFLWENKRFPDTASFAAALGIERHGVRVRKQEIFENYEVPAEPAAIAPQTWTLRRGSIAIDAGARLANINDDFEGQAPDLGAHEFGKPAPHYGPRP